MSIRRASRLTRTTSIVILVGVAVTGCGGDDGGSSRGGSGRGGEGVVKQEFVAKADAICADANEKEAALGAEGPGWMYSEQFDDPKFLAEFNDVGRAALRKLRALTPPEEDRKAVAAVVDSIARMVRALDARIATLRAGQEESSAVRAYERGYTDLAAAAGPLGLTECQGLLL